MLRRTSFTKPAYERKPPSALVPVRATAPIVFKAVSQPKREYVRSRALLNACQHLACQHCSRIVPGGVCAAHSNWHQHGKGAHIKADDNRIAALCSVCHIDILDQGSKLSTAERQQMWWTAHQKTIRAILASGDWPLDVPVPDLRSFDD
jgi:hypothetical protein